MQFTVQRLAKPLATFAAILGVGFVALPGILEAGPFDNSRNQSVLEDAIQTLQWNENIRRQPPQSPQRPPEQPRPGPAVEQPDLSGLPQPAPVPVQPQADDAGPQPLLVKPHTGEPAQSQQPLIKPKLAEPSPDEAQPRPRRTPQPYVKGSPESQAPGEGQLVKPKLTQTPAQASVPATEKPVRKRRPAGMAKPEQAAKSQPATQTMESPAVEPTIDRRGPVAKTAGRVHQPEWDSMSPSVLKEAFNPAQTGQPAVSPFPQSGETAQSSPLVNPRIGPR